MGTPPSSGIIWLFMVYAVGLFWTFFVSLQILKLAITKRSKFFYRKKRTTIPPVLNDKSLGEHRFIKLKNVRLHYVVSGPTDRPLMLMLHGFPEFWYSWRHQIREFNQDYRVVAVDMRGYGESTSPTEVSEYTLDKLTADVAELIHALGYDKCILLGHDWGGAVTWALLTMNPELVSQAIIFNCPKPEAMMKHMTSNWKQFMKSWYMFFVNMPYIPEWFFGTGDIRMLDNAFRGKAMGAKAGAFTDEDMEAFKYNFREPKYFTGPMNYIRAVLRYGQCYKPEKVQETPVMLIWGTQDGALNKEMADLSRKYVNDFTLRYIEGASHWVQQDEPEIVNGHIKEFLEKQNTLLGE